ncbi:hypothetical protein AAFF_G00387760 [Aldrovandia affinis]|uniref:Uncharacterized protein n=1 Tax=Aldrovandia affinis TaxID=143900 RepID=A0AAD7SEX2_9TELE|nr:hypothetical protein AAFF_G00387760 [Aldrovandia affinis]
MCMINPVAKRRANRQWMGLQGKVSGCLLIAAVSEEWGQEQVVNVWLPKRCKRGDSLCGNGLLFLPLAQQGE